MHRSTAGSLLNSNSEEPIYNKSQESRSKFDLLFCPSLFLAPGLLVYAGHLLTPLSAESDDKSLVVKSGAFRVSIHQRKEYEPCSVNRSQKDEGNVRDVA